MQGIDKKLEDKLLAGEGLDFSEIKKILGDLSLEELLHLANEVREKNAGNKVDLCSIINAKSGKCSENCRFCAQSVHYHTDIEEYSVLDAEKILERALEYQEAGIHRFSLVTSGRGVLKGDFAKILEIYKYLEDKTDLKLCASHGLLEEEELEQLKGIGIINYHHNLETCKEFFPNICTSHTYEERVETIKKAQKIGLNVCCGGIIGLGETEDQRIQLALEVSDLKIQSIPINILMPIKGTPLENVTPLTKEEILRSLAFFRLANPKSIIRFAGGRKTLGPDDKRGFLGGANGAIVGDYLTTVGPSVKRDIEMLEKLGLEVL